MLEIGCAEGDLLAALRPSRGLGIDTDPIAIRMAGERHSGSTGPGPDADGDGHRHITGWTKKPQAPGPRASELEFQVADIHGFSSNETFDYIVLADVLIMLKDLQLAFDRIRSLCHADTRIFVASHNAAWQGIIELAERFNLKRKGGQNWLGMADIRNFCRLTDFTVRHEGTTLLLPVKLGPLSDSLNAMLAPLPRVSANGTLLQPKSPFWPIHWIQYFVLQPVAIGAAEPLSVSVIVPTRNEVGNIEACVESIPDMGSGTEIIFVDGCSTDGTIEAIRAMMDRYPDKRIRLIHQVDPDAPVDAALSSDMAAAQRSGRMLPQGKADATRKGFAEATGDVLMILDADLTVEPRELPRFFDVLARGQAEFVNGSRLLYPMEGGAMRFINLLGNKFFSAVFSWILSQYVKDTLCGTKVLRRTDYERVQAWYRTIGDFDPFGDFELLFGATASGMRIVDLPIHYRRRVHGVVKIDNWKHAPLLFRMAWRGFLILKLGPKLRVGRATDGYQAREKEHFDNLVDETGEIWWGSTTPAGIERLRKARPSHAHCPVAQERSQGAGDWLRYRRLLPLYPGRPMPDLRLIGCDLSPKAVVAAQAALSDVPPPGLVCRSRRHRTAV